MGSSDRGSDEERDSDGFESMNNSRISSQSRREKRRAQSLKRRQERADRLWKPKWTLSRRMGSKRSTSPINQEVPLHPSLSNSPSLSPPSDSSQRSQESITPSSSTLRHQRVNSNQSNISTVSTISTFSSNKSNSLSFSTQSDLCLIQRGRELKEEEEEDESISDLEGIHGSNLNANNINDEKEMKEDTADSAVNALESGTMNCFDDVYDLMDRLKINGTAMELRDKTRIRKCIESNSLMKLKSFEKALLLQKVSEL